MKIGLDFDGVISDCGKLKSDVAKMLYEVDIPSEKFKKELVFANNQLTPQQYRELQKLIYGTREYGFLMQPVAEVRNYLSQLAQDGHTTLVVTSRENTELFVAE